MVVHEPEAASLEFVDIADLVQTLSLSFVDGRKINSCSARCEIKQQRNRPQTPPLLLGTRMKRCSAAELWTALKPTITFVAMCCICAGIMMGLESQAELSRQRAAVADWDDLTAQTSTSNVTELRAIARSVIGPRPVVANRDWTFIGALWVPIAPRHTTPLLGARAFTR